MMVMPKVLILTLALSTLGFAEVYADQTMLIKPQLFLEKSIADQDEASIVLTISSDIYDLTDNMLLYSDSTVKELGSVNLTYQPLFLFDTINIISISNYFDQIMPIISSNDSLNIEMIEIL